MTHPNAPLSYEGRLRLVERCRSRPIAHVAAVTRHALSTVPRPQERKPGLRLPALHRDGFSRPAYTEPLPDENGATAAGFLARSKVWFAAHGITHTHRIVTDNGACYRSNDFARIVGNETRHQKTKPHTPRHNAKVERYQRILAEELLYTRECRSEEERSAAIAVWNIHYIYHRPHSASGGPPASRLRSGVTNVQPSYNQVLTGTSSRRYGDRVAA